MAEIELKTIETVSNQPFRKLVTTIGELPSAFIESMSYYEMLAWLVNWLENTVIPAVNNNAEAVEELQGLFVELKTFVDNYFENLDVQEEINNKLDQMTEDGTLQEIITQYIQSNVAWTFDTVAEMKAATNLVAGSYARTLGFHQINDGGEGIYKITDTATPNEMNIISIANNLFAVLHVNEENIYPEMFGAYGDGTTDDTSVIQYILDNHLKCNFYNKTYLSKGLFIRRNQTLNGDNTILKGDNTTEGLKLYNVENSQIREFKITGITVRDYTTGIMAINAVQGEFTDVTVRNCGTGAIFAGGSYIDKFYNCKFNYCENDGFNVGFEVTHPLTNTIVLPDIATMDFFTCNFYGNGGYGVNGWMRVFNFFGGYSENNALGAVCLCSKNNRSCAQNSFIGFDIEQEDYAYVFEAEDNNTYVRVSDLNIIGGQIALKDYADTQQAIVYIKGRPSLSYCYNIKIQSRTTDYVAESTPERYHIYSTSTQDKIAQIEISVGNQNNSTLHTNLTMFIPNDLYRTTEFELPLRLFGKFYDSTSAKVILPANETCVITIPNMKHLTRVIVSTDENMNLSLNTAGMPLTDFRTTGGSTGVNETTHTFNFGNAVNTLIFRNIFTSQSTTINSVKITALLSK